MKPHERPKIKYGEKVIKGRLTVRGKRSVVYVCGKCSRLHTGRDGLHFASWCCAELVKCRDCGEWTEKHYTHCKDCRCRLDRKRWKEKEAVQWDGEFPIGLWDSDRYFLSGDDLIEYIDDCDGISCDEDFLELKFTTCEQNKPRHFEINDYCCDELAEDGEIDDESINERVNAIIAETGVLSYSMTGKKIDTSVILAMFPEVREAYCEDGE